jgi:hypothetical protein
MTEYEQKVAAFREKHKGGAMIAPPEVAPAEKPRTRRGRPSKVESKAGNLVHDSEVLRTAAALLNMNPHKDAGKFGVSRQTLAKWLRGDTPAPRAAFVLLLDEVLKAVEAGTANINAAAEARLNKAIDERIAAALKIMEHLNQRKGVQK